MQYLETLKNERYHSCCCENSGTPRCLILYKGVSNHMKWNIAMGDHRSPLCAAFFFFFGINSGQKILTLIFEMTFHSLICLTSRRSKFNKSFKLQSSWSIAIFNLAESQSFYHFLNFSSSRSVKSSNIYSNKSFKNITAVLAIFPVNTNRLLSF